MISLIISQFNSEPIASTTPTGIRGASLSTAKNDVTQNDIVGSNLEVLGIELQIPSTIPNEDSIQVVYAPTVSSASAKGIVLLLHACTHTALKFFSPSHTCPDCVGLSEELRIARLVLKKNYIPVAISCNNRKSGCWSNPDHQRIQTVLQHELFAGYDTIYAIGASSGGSFAAQLLVRDVADGALVMVMSLNKETTSKLKNNPKPLFLAPMPRDKGTTSGTIQNYEYLKEVNTNNDKQMVVLDVESCIAQSMGIS